MIDKNFYLENLSAFDILIEDEDRKQAEQVIFRVYSILQRDKIWLHEVATEEEIFEEDVELLTEVEEELKELDLKYNFRFDDFYKLVQQEMKKRQSTSSLNLDVSPDLNEEEDLEDDEMENFYLDEEENEDFAIDDEDDEDFYKDEQELDQFSHFSDEELDSVTDYILERAKTKFDYPEFLTEFPETEENFIDVEFILPLIAAKAFGETTPEIAEKIQESFEMAGYDIEINDLILLIDEKSKELGLEILAFKIAADSLQQGAHPTAVVHQISQLLRP